MFAKSSKQHTVILGVILVCIAGNFNPASSYFTTKGQNIVDRATQTQVVILRGLAPGGWLELESTPYDGRARYMEKAVTALIGQANADTFWNLYHSNYLTEQDIKAMKGWGMNALRIPLLGSLIQPYDSQPAAPPYKYDSLGWRLLDSLVNWCERWQMGIIWDMHCPPGSPNGQQYSDADGDSATLWSDTATYWPRTRDLWFKIAYRYKTRPCIVGYDFLNEPLLSNMGYNPSLLRKLYVELTDTIRTVDTSGIMFVEGQWYARDFSILEPINWDKHLVIAYHEYPPPTSCNGFKGSQNGFTWDLCAERTKYNIPVWIGETGEVAPPYTDNAQATDFYNSNNMGWSWWTAKWFNNNNQPWNLPTTSGYQIILNYWENGAAKPNADSAKKWLFDQARRTNSSYCTFLPTMVSSLHPLNPNGVVTVKNTVVQKSDDAVLVSYKAGAMLVQLPTAQRFLMTLISTDGRVQKSASGFGREFRTNVEGLAAGIYIVNITSRAATISRNVLISR